MTKEKKHTNNEKREQGKKSIELVDKVWNKVLKNVRVYVLL